MADNVTMIDPQGIARQIPSEQVEAATQAGAKPATKIVDPQGTPRWIPNDQVDAAVQAGGKRFGAVESPIQPPGVAAPSLRTPGEMETSELGYMQENTDTAARNVGGVAMGGVKGMQGTLKGAIDLGFKTSPAVRLAEAVGIAPKKGHEIAAAKVKEALMPESGIQAQGGAEPRSIPEWIGYGGENLIEFILGDEALKGLSIAEKMKNAAQVAGIFEKSPRLMKALQMGADINKAVGSLGPAERAILQDNPILARLVGVGMDSLRQGAVQAGQTAVKTGGDIREAAKEGATMTGTSAVIGAPIAVAGGALERAGKLGRTLETAQKGEKGVLAVAKGAEAAPQAAETVEGAVKPAIEAPAPGIVPTHQEIAANTSRAVSDVETKMHKTFDEGIQKISKNLGDKTIELDKSPLAAAAKEAQAALKQEPKGLTERMGKSLQGMIPGTERGEKMVGSLLGEAQKGEDAVPSWLLGEEVKIGSAGTAAAEAKPEALTIDNLINYRQRLGKLAGQMAYDDPNKQVIYKLVNGVDDTIQKMADESGKPETAKFYQGLREQYKNQVQFFNPASAKAAGNPVRAQIAQKLQSGDLNNAPQYLLGGNNSLAKVREAKNLLGEESVDNLATQTIRRWSADAVNPETGKLNAKKLIDQWNKVPADTREEFFSKANVGYKQMIEDLKESPDVNRVTLDRLNRLIRFGVFPAAGYATGRAIGGGDHRAEFYGALAGMLYGGGRREVANDLIKFLAEHPGYLSAAEKATAVGRSPITKAAGTVVRQQAAQEVMGKPNVLGDVYQGAAETMGANQ